MTLDEFLAHFPDAKPDGNGYAATCPAHEDHRASLSIGAGGDGKILVKCHAGCTAANICHAVGLTLSSLFPERSTRPANGRGRIVAAYDYRDGGGSLVYQVCRFDPKDFRQRRPDGNGGWVWKMQGVSRVLYRLPELVNADPDEVVYLVEGEKDADNLASLGLVATCNAGGAGKWQKAYTASLRDRHVAIVPDNDQPGEQHAEHVAKQLAGTAASVRILRLPGLPPKGDASDWINAGGTADELRGLASNVETEPAAVLQNSAQAADDRPAAALDRVEVFVTPDEHVVNELALAGLTKADDVFHRAGRLVHVIDDAGDVGGVTRSGTPHIRELPPAILRERLARHCYFTREHENGTSQIAPPKWCSEALHSRGHWPGLRMLSGVTTSPTMRRDGTILATAGYDSTSGLLYVPDGDPPGIPDSPSRDDAIRAAGELLDVVQDFPFAKAEHQSAWLASLLTPIARPAFRGPSPMFLVDANVRGSGKSLLCDVVGEIVTGAPMPRLTAPRDDDECRKRITAIAQAGDRMVLLDNIAGSLGSASLDAAITSETWRDRILGKTEMVVFPLHAIFYATGNNVILQADTSRRVAHVRLDSPEETPEERTDFAHPDLRRHVRENRLRLLTAALTVLRAYVVAGRPQSKLTPWGSFEGWSDFVRQAIVWAGLPDPAGTRRDLAEQSDRDAAALRQIIAGWDELDPDFHKLTTREIADRLEKHPDRYEAVRAGLEELCDRGLTPRAIGYILRRFKGRTIAGRRIDNQTGRSRTIRWFVSGGDGVDGGDGSDPSYAGEDSESLTTYWEGGETSPPLSPSPPLTTDTYDSGEGPQEREVWHF